MKAIRGTCKVCGTRHTIIDGHSLASKIYREQFREAHGREPSWADAVAHLPPDLQERWRKVVESMALEMDNDE